MAVLHSGLLSLLPVEKLAYLPLMMGFSSYLWQFLWHQTVCSALLGFTVNTLFMVLREDLNVSGDSLIFCAQNITI